MLFCLLKFYARDLWGTALSFDRLELRILYVSQWKTSDLTTDHYFKFIKKINFNPGLVKKQEFFLESFIL